MINFLNIPVLALAERTVTVGHIILIPALFFLGYLLARWVGRILVREMTARNVDPDLTHLVKRIYLIIIIAVLVITALEVLNVPLTAFAFVSGAVAIGIGFGAQNIINNFISGWILLWERPIRIGDFLEVGDSKGTVEAINTRSTRIKRIDGVHLLIPNSQLLENTVINWTLIDHLTRTSVRVGVAYGSPVRQVAELIARAVTEHPEVLQDPKPIVIFDDFGDSALNFEASFWAMASSDKDLRVIRSDLRFRIDELFREHGITIAFPQLDVHLDVPGAVAIRRVETAELNGARANE